MVRSRESTDHGVLIGRSKAKFASDRSKNIPRGLKPWDLQSRAKRSIRAVRGARPSPEEFYLPKRCVAPARARRATHAQAPSSAPFPLARSPHEPETFLARRTVRLAARLDSNDGHLRHPGGCRPRGRLLLPEGARGISRSAPSRSPPQARYAIAPRPPSRASNPRTFGFRPNRSAQPRRPGPRPHPTPERSRGVPRRGSRERE